MCVFARKQIILARGSVLLCMGTDMSGDMGDDDPSLRAGADGLAQCGSGLDANPSARWSFEYWFVTGRIPPLNRRGCG